MKNILLLFFSLAMAGMVLPARAQMVTVRGKVIDQSTKAPLAHANIFIIGKSHGTVSNEAGEFEFVVPEALQNDTLTISYLGYAPFKQVVGRVTGRVFALNPAVVTLDEVVFSENTAEDLMKRALDKIRQNYPVQPYLLKGFYRDWKIFEIPGADSSRASLIEAAVTIYDKGYRHANNKSLKEDIYLDEIRKSKSAGTIYNYLDLLLKQNYVRHNKTKNIGGLPSVLDLDKATEYKLVRNVQYGDATAHLITGTLANKLGQYEVYIDDEDLAFISIKFLGNAKGDSVLGTEPLPWIKKRNEMIFVENELQFRKFNGVYFPAFIKAHWRTRTVAEATNEVAERKEFFLELLINEVITEGVDQKKALLKSPMAAKMPLEQQVKPYNAAFWENFNIIKENPLETRLTKLLSEQEKMEDQFKNQKSDPTKAEKKKALTRKNTGNGDTDTEEGEDNE